MQGVTAKKAATLPLLAMLLGNVTLAFGPVFVRSADVGPVAAAFWRTALAVPFLLALCPLARQPIPRLDRRLTGLVLLAGLCFAGDLGSWHVGILGTTLANATLFGNCATLMFPVYGFVVARAWPDRTQGLALVIALVGALLLMGRSYTLSRDQLAGDLVCLFAGILYTAYFVIMMRAREQLAALPVLALSTIVSAPALLVAALLLGERIWPGDWTPLIAVALASQVVGQGLMIYALGRLSPLVIGLGLLVQPVVAAAAGWTLYGEVLGTLDLVGAVLVAIALVLVRRESAPKLAPQVASAD